MEKIIYLDNNATTAVAPEAFEAMRPFLTELYGNPSSIHTFGGQVAAHVEDARAKLLNVDELDVSAVVFELGADFAVDDRLNSDNLLDNGECVEVVDFFGGVRGFGFVLFPEAVENFLDLVETCAACAPGLGVLGDLFGGAEVVFLWLRVVYQIKGVEKTALITDSLACAASDEGVAFDPRVILEDGVCKLADHSALAGSIATMDRLIRTCVQMANIPMEDACRMASETPAKIMGVFDRKGSLEDGKDADIMMFDKDLKLTYVMQMGNEVTNEL